MKKNSFTPVINLSGPLPFPLFAAQILLATQREREAHPAEMAFAHGFVHRDGRYVALDGVGQFWQTGASQDASAMCAWNIRRHRDFIDVKLVSC